MAHHHIRQGLLVGVLGGHVTDIFALAEHRHPVGDIQHLMELVGDDDEGLTVRLHVPHDLEQLVRLLRRQDGGRLVQDQNIRAPEQYLDDLHSLLLGNGHIVDLLVGVDVKAVLIADLLDFLAGLGQVQLALKTQNDVLRGGEHIHQLEMLMDHADAIVECVLGGGDGHRLAVNIDLSLIGEVDAGKHIHQRGLAAAVFTQQRQDLAFAQFQIDGVVRHDLAEPLRYVFHFYRTRRSQGSHPFFSGGGVSTVPRRIVRYG